MKSNALSVSHVILSTVSGCHLLTVSFSFFLDLLLSGFSLSLYCFYCTLLSVHCIREAVFHRQKAAHAKQNLTNYKIKK